MSLKQTATIWLALAATVLIILQAVWAQPAQPALARLAALEAELAGLEAAVREREDIKAIKRLQRAYGYYVDQGQAGEIAELFAADGTAELANMGVYVGKERVAALYRALLGEGPRTGWLNNHIILQSVIHVAADGMTAQGRWRALIQSGEHGASAIWTEGPYENEYVREDGVWRISKLHWYQTMAANYSPGWHLEQLPLPGPLADLPPDLPPTAVYGTYPDVYVPPFHYVNPVSGRASGADR